VCWMEKILKYRCFPLLMFIISLGWMNQAVALSTDSLKCGKKKIIVGGDFDYKPYTFLDSDGAARGYDVDIISTIAKQHNFDLEFQFTRWTEALENLKSGKVDVLLGVFYTEQRALVYDFTIPHTVESYGLFVRKQSEIKELDDIFGKELIVLKGDASIEKFIKPMGLYENSVQVNSLPYAIGLLSSGMHDVVIAPYSIAIETIESEKIKNIVLIVLW
jgi:ABC-type amino acid transport substrate-binding protein